MNLAQYKARVDGGLVAVLDNQARISPTKETQKLLSRLKKVTTNGKRFRPSLFFLTYQAYGGSDCPVSIGVAIELLHQALLIHDDLIDGDDYRRGKLNIAGMYKKDEEHNLTNKANSMALLAGDLCLSLITQLIIKDRQLSLETKLDILNLFSNALSNCVYGQQLDTLNSNKSVREFDEKSQTKIYSLKTASYSTLLPMSIASSLLKISNEQRRKINAFAKSLGVYYQLVNDFEGYFKKTKAGYQLSDFSSGKLTYPYFIGQKLVQDRQLRKLDRLYSKPNLSEKQKLAVVNMLTECGARKASLSYIHNYLNRSLRLLNNLNLKIEGKSELLALIDSLKV